MAAFWGVHDRVNDDVVDLCVNAFADTTARRAIGKILILAGKEQITLQEPVAKVDVLESRPAAQRVVLVGENSLNAL